MPKFLKIFLLLKVRIRVNPRLLKTGRRRSVVHLIYYILFVGCRTPGIGDTYVCFVL